METEDTIRFRYCGKVVEGKVKEYINDPLHPNSMKVEYNGKYVRVMPSEVVK